MTTIRVAKRRRYTQLDRRCLNDSELSFRARGVLAWLLDKPDDWQADAESISKNGTEGRDAIRAALVELRNRGYLIQRRWRDGAGKWQSESFLYEHPDVADHSGIPAEVPQHWETSAGKSGGKRQKTVENTEPPHAPSGHEEDDVRVVFQAWAESTDTKVILDGKRQRLISERLRYFSIEDLVAAVRGWKFSPYHRGENDRRIIYNTLELVLRDAGHVEMFRDLYRTANSAAPASLFDQCSMCDNTGRRYDEEQDIMVRCSCQQEATG